MKQIKSESEILGKTIKKIFSMDLGRKVFVFKNNTFAVYSEDQLDGEIGLVKEDQIRWDFDKYFRVGLITKKEWQERRKIYNEELLKGRKVQYEILRKEFEGK